MSYVIFNNLVNLSGAPTPSSGYTVAYDLDGIIKQKDEFGVITPIAGSLSATTPSLSEVLVVGNTTGTNNLIIASGTSIISDFGNGQINFVYATDSHVYISSDNGLNQESYIDLNDKKIVLKSSGASRSINIGVSYNSNSYDYQEIYVTENKLVTKTVNDYDKNSIFIGTRNSSISAGKTNSVVIGGYGISATMSNTVYLGNSVNINGKYTLPSVDGTTGQVLRTDGFGTIYWSASSGNFTNGITEISPSVYGLGGTLSQNTLLDGNGLTFSIVNANTISLSASIVNLGQSVVINNSYTLPSSLGPSGSVLVTDGSGNVNWQTITESQKLSNVLSYGNDSDIYSIMMGTSTTIYSSNGGGDLSLDKYGPGTVLLSTDGGAYSIESQLYLSESYSELSNKSNVGQLLIVGAYSQSVSKNYSEINLDNTKFIIKSFDDSNIIEGSITKNYNLYSSFGQGPNLNIRSGKSLSYTGRISLSVNQNEIVIQENTSTTASTPSLDGYQNRAVFVSSQGSTINPGVFNSPVLGGISLIAATSNTVYLGNKVNINNAYTLPSTDGALGYVITTDGAGNCSWTQSSVSSLTKYVTSNRSMTASQIDTITHNLGTQYIGITVWSYDVNDMVGFSANNRTSNSVDISVSVTGNYDIIIIG